MLLYSVFLLFTNDQPKGKHRWHFHALGTAIISQKKPRRITPTGKRISYPSIRMVFFSGTFFASFFGKVKLSTPFSYLALMSSSVILLPT